MSDHPTLQEAASDALTVQDACNLCGVAQAFARAMLTVLDDCRSKGQGTDEMRKHPITIAFMDKLRFMVNNPSPSEFAAAFDAVEEMAGKKVST
jgi:hypothetical protein